MVVAVIVVVFMPVVVATKMAAGGVGAVFGFKRLTHLGHDQVHGAQHVGQHMVGLNLEVVGFELNRHMPVAKVVGRADQVKRRAVVRAMGDLEHGLRCCPDLDQGTVMRHQHVTTARDRATRQKYAQLAPGGVGRIKTAFLAHVPVQLDSAGPFEQHRCQTGALGDEFGDVDHGQKR